MEFRLLYRGPLPAAGSNTRVREKQAIRRALHPQLRHLWNTHPALRGTRENRHAVNDHLLATKYGYRFLPVVNKYLHLICSLDILFLRREAPGDLVHGGDLDNRLKVLFDGLRMPSSHDELAGEAPGTDDDPFFCLLEDDALIAQLQVTTDRLLIPPESQERERDVCLVIKVATASVKPGVLGSVT